MANLKSQGFYHDISTTIMRLFMTSYRKVEESTFPSKKIVVYMIVVLI